MVNQPNKHLKTRNRTGRNSAEEPMLYTRAGFLSWRSMIRHDELYDMLGPWVLNCLTLNP